MIDKLAFLLPEIALFVATCVVMVLGLSRERTLRKASAWVCGLGLLVALVLAWQTTPAPDVLSAYAGQKLLPNLVSYGKVIVAGVGLLLLLLAAGTVDRDEEARIVGGGAFDPLRSNRAEFYSFFMFSLTGLMLCASADDLIWLFLALELTSLPTYIMVTISTRKSRSQEAGVKYFFLGALGAAIFLYGFVLIYGATGTTKLDGIAAAFDAHGVGDIGLAGVLLSILGLGFKIAAVPMHFYTADVYQGAASQISAFLAFVPKTAGFFALLLLLAAVGYDHGPQGLPEPVRLTLWIMAALSMTVGNILALWQSSVKRVLAYSSIAHSGYMLVGLIAGPGEGSFTTNGLAAVLFYLLCYGVMNVGAFAVLASLERSGRQGPEEIESVDDLRGLCKAQPWLGWTMVLCALSLLGFPPLLGFFGKVPLFTSAISAGEYVLVVVLGVNSAIAAFYYLRLVAMPLLEKPDPSAAPIAACEFQSRGLAGVLSAAGVLALVAFSGTLMAKSHHAANYKLSLYPDAPAERPSGDASSLFRSLPGVGGGSPADASQTPSK